MQGIYNYKPETNHVPGVYSVAAVLYLQFVLHVMLLRPLNTFCLLHVPVTVHREQSVKKEYQQDATI